MLLDKFKVHWHIRRAVKRSSWWVKRALADGFDSSLGLLVAIAMNSLISPAYVRSHLPAELHQCNGNENQAQVKSLNFSPDFQLVLKATDLYHDKRIMIDTGCDTSPYPSFLKKHLGQYDTCRNGSYPFFHGEESSKYSWTQQANLLSGTVLV